ncbi:hypothetical protein [Flavobacterium sp. ZB4R12]|uniref:hypothetical protein n=1 Tax=Flavobacterium sp. ZB4R12 TaxID=3398732 RepID=UPI003AAF1056
MNWIQKTVVFIGLSLVLLFAFNASESSIEKIQLEKSSSSFSADPIHSSVFIQPQVSGTFTLHYKTTDYTIAKYFENFLIVIPDFKVNTFFSRFAKQDINRCETVSLLLFPFHFFW